MTAMRYDTSKFSPCLHHSSAVAMSVFRHGDDFVVSDTRTQRKEFEKQLSNHLMVKHLATLGPYTSLTEVRMLNRIVRWVKPPNRSGHERIRYETDPRHAELTIHQFGLSNSARSVSTPSGKSKPGVDLSSLLHSTDHTLCRSATMRLCYLALERRDLQFPLKELARWETLKSRQMFHWTWVIGSEIVREIEESFHVGVFADSDHAGCLKTRQSTSSSKLYGSHMLRSTSTTQGVISPSSGESECYALVKGTSPGLGAVSMFKNFGVDINKTPRLTEQCWK